MSKKIATRSFHRLLPDLSRLGCKSYKAGHNVHWIQALHSANKPEVAAQTWTGKIVTVEDEVVTVRKPDGSVARFRNHDPDRLVVILEHKGVEVTVNEQYAILQAGITPAGSFCISVQADKGEPLGPCYFGDLPLSATDLDSSGGDDE